MNKKALEQIEELSNSIESVIAVMHCFCSEYIDNSPDEKVMAITLDPRQFDALGNAIFSMIQNLQRKTARLAELMNGTTSPDETLTN